MDRRSSLRCTLSRHSHARPSPGFHPREPPSTFRFALPGVEKPRNITHSPLASFSSLSVPLSIFLLSRFYAFISVPFSFRSSSPFSIFSALRNGSLAIASCWLWLFDFPFCGVYSDLITHECSSCHNCS